MTALFLSVGLLIFLTTTAIIIYGIVTAVSQRRRDRRSPRLNVAATVVAKRTHTSVQHRAGDGFSAMRTTHYYATFEFDSRDRMELSVPYDQYGYLAEGDRGILQFQGSQFIGFVRQ